AGEMGSDKFINIFKSNLADEIKLGKVVPIRADSGEAVGILSRMLSGRGLSDMVFIDAEHSYEAVATDMVNYNPLLRSGGILSGHDYSVAFPGVMKAVEELVPNWKIGSGSIWCAIKP